jgi:hypothetical protein
MKYFGQFKTLAASRIFGAILGCALIYTMFCYGYVSFSKLPFIDDWSFVKATKEFVLGERGLQYLLDFHNGHPVLPSRISFLLSYWLCGLNLSPLRWTSLFVMIGFSAFFSVCLQRDLELAVGKQRISSILFSLPIFLLLLSPISWELYSLAMGVGSFVGVAGVCAAILMMGFWLEEHRICWVVGSLVAATIATVSFGAGVAVWLCLGVLAILGWDRKQLAAIFVLVFVSVSFMLYLASPAGTGGLPKLLELPLFVLVTIGSSVSPVLSGSITSIYFVVMALFVLTFAAAAVFVALTLDRKRTAKYVAIILFGAINVAAITVTRYQLGLENAASSRYSIFVAPIVIGTTGVFVVSFYSLRVSRYLYIAFFFSIAPSLLMANIQEQRTAIYRGAAFERMRQALMTESYRDNATLRTTFYVTDQDAQIVADMVEFMKQRRLNIFHGAGTRDAGGSH